jgi:DNA-binding GntR family transcriptional regulator
VFTADDEPIIMFVNYIPAAVFQECLTFEQALEPGATEPFFEFFSKKCSRRVKYLTSLIKPKVAKDSNLPEIFQFEDPSTPLLIVEDIGYDANDDPVFFSLEYLVGEASTFHVIRHVENI